MSNTYIYDKSVIENGEVIESEKVTKEELRKLVLITNGTGGCGKDTFAYILGKYVDVVKISSIEPAKKVAEYAGWNREKTEKARKFLSDLKLAMTEYDDAPFKYLEENHKWYMYAWSHPQFDGKNEPHVLIMDIREPEEIERAKQAFGAKTVLIKNDRIAPITSNMADANVLNYNYDYVVENNGTLDDFEETIKKWAEENVM
jgi:hypothetical protein